MQLQYTVLCASTVWVGAAQTTRMVVTRASEVRFGCRTSGLNRLSPPPIDMSDTAEQHVANAVFFYMDTTIYRRDSNKRAEYRAKIMVSGSGEE